MAYQADIAVPFASTSDGYINLQGIIPDNCLTSTPEPSATAQQSKGAAVKQKRKQFSSCDACRLRKVRCNRVEGNVQCSNCISKGIVCTNAFTEESVHGKGKRISQAKEAYGTSSTVMVRTSKPTVDSMHASMRDMNGAIMSSSTLRELLAIFKVKCSDLLPSTQLDCLYTSCEQQNFNINAMDELDQILCLSTAAISTYVLEQSPKDGQITTGPRSNDSKDLENQVLQLSDRFGLLRKPSHRGMQALRMMMVISSDDESAKSRRSATYKSFERTYVDHLRTLSEDGTFGELETSTFFWSGILGDLFGSAMSGSAPSFTQEDFETFAPYLQLGTQDMIEMIGSCQRESIDLGTGLIFAALCTLMRSYWQRVTSAKARQRPFLDLEMMQEILPELERLGSIQEIYEQRIRSLFGNSWPASIQQWTEIMRFLSLNIVTMSLVELDKAINKEMTGSLSLARMASLHQIHDSLLARFWQDIDWIYNKRTPRVAPKFLSVADGLITYVAVHRFRLLLKIPSVEEGSVSDSSWSMEKKLRMAKYFLGACEYLANHVASIYAEIEDLKRAYNELEQRAASLASGFAVPTLLFEAPVHAPYTQLNQTPSPETTMDPIHIKQDLSWLDDILGPQGPSATAPDSFTASLEELQWPFVNVNGATGAFSDPSMQW